MEEHTASISEVKRDISNLVTRVASGQERIIVTSRGKPKAVLVSLEDYARFQEQIPHTTHQQWAEWLHRARELSQHILRERGGQPLDIDLVVQTAKDDLESRHDEFFEY